MAAGRRGFTLVELVIVVGICALLLSISFPTLTNFREKIYLEAIARGAASELRKTQSQAMSRSENFGWDISLFNLPPGVLAVNIRKFIFSSSGFPLVGGTGTQLLRDHHGHGRKVILSSAGRVRVE